jgi:hypothetical protein
MNCALCESCGGMAVIDSTSTAYPLDFMLLYLRPEQGLETCDQAGLSGILNMPVRSPAIPAIGSPDSYITSINKCFVLG